MTGRRGRPERQAALRRGSQSEIAAAAFLALKRYRILARNHAGGGGEIDIVALRGDTVVFVEVKRRAGLDAAAEAIDGPKRRRLARAIAHWRSRNPWCERYALRGDAVLLAPWRWPRHVEDAFPVDA
ncbi:YraN family protein [Alsobacter sp. R-9]